MRPKSGISGCIILDGRIVPGISSAVWQELHWDENNGP